jgi:transposase
VNRITIYNWFHAWESRHLAGLYDKKGKGRPQSFHHEQKEQIRQWVKQFPKNLNRVGALIAEEFGRKVSKKMIKRVLKHVQYSWRRIRRKPPQHPDSHIYHARREALAVLIAEAEGGIIDLRYVDESGFCLVPYIPYAWQEKGETIAIESMPSKRMNVVGFFNTHNELEAYSIAGSVTSDVVIRCIDDFCPHVQEPTVLVMDNASIHTSKAFQEKSPIWEAQGIDIFYLPKYAPAFNLIEILWRLMKYV